MTVAYAAHRLSGIVTPANVAYTVEELSHQLKSSGSKAIFTCSSLLANALQAAELTGIPRKNVYAIDLPTESPVNDSTVLSIDQMILKGQNLAPLEPLIFSRGQGARQTAFLCYSSGTSGQPVRKMVLS